MSTVSLTRRQPASVWIPIKLPSLNEVIADAKVLGVATPGRRRVRWSQYAAAKRSLQKALVPLFVTTLPRFSTRVFLRFEWVEQNQRRDLDNVAGGGRKVILDSLVAAGILCNDGWAQIAGWTDAFSVDAKAPGVRLTIEPC